MQLAVVRISSFWSFGPDPVEIKLDSMTYLLGPNGAGKTAVLTALARMFGTTGAIRTVLPSDFHVALGEVPIDGKAASLWIEADFTFPEVKEGKNTAAVPIFFSHMQLQSIGEVPGVRIRLTAEMDESGEIEQRLEYVLATDPDGVPTQLLACPSLIGKQFRSTTSRPDATLPTTLLIAPPRSSAGRFVRRIGRLSVARPTICPSNSVKRSRKMLALQPSEGP